MQSEDARMHIFLERLEFLFRQIARNFLVKQILDQSDITNINLNENQILLPDVFCGTEAEIYISTNYIDNDIVILFKESTRQFYLKFCEVLRTKVNFNNESLKWFGKFSPKEVLSGATQSIVPILVKMFPNERKNFEIIDTQYRALADLQEVKSFENETISDFWAKVSIIKN